jgi:hypothetical protein
MKGILIRLSLCRTRRHQTDCLLLHFHTTSAMMLRAPPAVALSPVLRQNSKTLAQLASRWSKPSDVDTRSYTVFIHSSVLRCKPTNLLPFSFETQIKKPSRWFWDPNHQTVDLGFEAQTKKLPNHWQIVATGFEAKPKNLNFSSPPRVWCGSHTMSPDLPIVRPPSTQLVPDHSRSSAPSLLLLPRSSSLPVVLHSPLTHHEISKHVSPHRITQYGFVQPKCAKFKSEQVNYSSHI